MGIVPVSDKSSSSVVKAGWGKHENKTRVKSQRDKDNQTQSVYTDNLQHVNHASQMSHNLLFFSQEKQN